ncbi:thioredoxin family protein [Maribacter hydrothermalis]|uniref:thioredoxin family protein n=1 Tax=Maribacter hydrothermalis TaxID=1836467 RepID=UPI000941A6E8|nr:thioredoxin family protein [Maribacter hydrothermalis]APQ16695.1 hypothetical protein BTR34_04880 [Maribacter hydrothermalis]
MKLSFLITTLLLGFACNLHAQNINKEITIDVKQPYLVGEISILGLSSNSYNTWFQPNFESYKTNTGKLERIKEVLKTYQVLIFMGTWCGDSKREVPRFIRILKSIDFPMENLKIVALDKSKNSYKKSPQGEEWGLNIRRVPTFIFYKNGREINRIIESPITTLEDDIVKIILHENISQTIRQHYILTSKNVTIQLL